MSFRLPSSLSPSKVSAFKDCPLAFRFSAIDRLPEAPTKWTVKGTLVHKVLEKLFWEIPKGKRTPKAALEKLEQVWQMTQSELSFIQLDLSSDAKAQMLNESKQLVKNYFQIEDPNQVNAVGMEVVLETQIHNLKLRGILDRLDIQDGELVVIDYKTGAVPSQLQEQSRLSGVHFYAFLCQQFFGKMPIRVELLYLSKPISITAIPSEQSTRAMAKKTQAIWGAVERGCKFEDFRPRVSKRCDFCSFKSICPAFNQCGPADENPFFMIQ